MKVTIDIDCTPEEARAFLGLPDLRPVHDAYVERLEKFVAEGLAAEDLANMVLKWMPMMEGGVDSWLSNFRSFADKATKPGS